MAHKYFRKIQQIAQDNLKNFEKVKETPKQKRKYTRHDKPIILVNSVNISQEDEENIEV